MVLLSLTAIASPYELSDTGRTNRPGQPAALVVFTPGLTASAYEPLLDALESAGLDTWTLRFPPAAQDADRITGQWIPEAAVEAAGGRPIAVIGYGLGGTLAALSIDAGALTPDALVLLGSPLRCEPLGLYDWLAQQSLPSSDLDLIGAQEARWQEMPVLELLIGTPLPQLEALSPGWLATLQSWAGGALSVDLRDDSVAVWAGASGLDNLAPPEWVRPAVPATSFFRFGYLRFESEDPDHIGLLSNPRALRMLSRWTATTLRER